MLSNQSTPSLNTPQITKADLEVLLQIFDRNKSLSSRLSEHKEVQQLRQFIQALNSGALSEAKKNTLGFLVFYTSNATKISDFYSLRNSQTQTLTLLGSIRKKLFPAFHKDVLAASDQHGNWLFLGGQAQVNFEALTQGSGQYAENIAYGLARLSRAGLLTGDQAAANRDALTQGSGQYAEGIATCLARLSQVALLTGDQTAANRDALTQGGGQYAESIASGLAHLSQAGLLTGDQAQANFEALTQGGGQYAESIASSLAHLSQAGLFRGDQARVNFEALIQGSGQYAWHIAYSLAHLSQAGLLTGDQAAANRDALTQGSGQYAEGIATGLVFLSRAGLLTGDQAQVNFAALTQGGGQYAEDIRIGLVQLSRAGLLSGDQAAANRDALTQGGGQYAISIANGLVLLSRAGLLTGDQAQTNTAFFLNYLKTDDEAGRSPEVLFELLERLKGSDQLTQTAFYLLFQPECIEDVIFDEIQELGVAIFMALDFSQEEVACLDVSVFVIQEIVLFYQSFCSSMDDELLEEAFKLVKILLMDADQPETSRGEAILSLCNKHLAEEKVGKKTPEEKKQRLEMMTYDVENYLAGKVSEEDFANQYLSAASQPLQRQEAISYQGSFFHKVVINKVPQVVFHALGAS